MSSNQPFRKYGGINRFKTHELLNNDTIHTNHLTVNEDTHLLCQTIYSSKSFSTFLGS